MSLIIGMVMAVAVIMLGLFLINNATAKGTSGIDQLTCNGKDYDGDGLVYYSDINFKPATVENDPCPCDSATAGEANAWYAIKGGLQASEIGFIGLLNDKEKISISTYEVIVTFLASGAATPEVLIDSSINTANGRLEVSATEPTYNNKEGFFCITGTGPNDTCRPEDFRRDFLSSVQDKVAICKTPLTRNQAPDKNQAVCEELMADFCRGRE